MHITRTKMKGVTTDSADFHYYNWVDRFNTSGQGEYASAITWVGCAAGAQSADEAMDGAARAVSVEFTRGASMAASTSNGGWKGRGHNPATSRPICCGTQKAGQNGSASGEDSDSTNPIAE